MVPKIAEDPRHPWGSGETRYRWDPEVRRVVGLLRARYSRAVPNTYVCHPWCGWGRFSVDWWGPGGRGDPIATELGWDLLRTAFELPGRPYLRHTIYQHQLWTDKGGYSTWRADDHSGALRHVHLTYWRDQAKTEPWES